jgi:O-acetyl-ADP-ribose deacetylase
MTENRIEIIQGDITTLAVDAIVNAANSSLMGGGGVDGAIHRAAGPELLEECRTHGGCPTGEVRITKGYQLPVKWVIHAVGPIWRGGKEGEVELLASCYRNAFEIATSEDYDVRTIAFPSISTGVYHFPIERACRIALRETRAFLARNETIEKVIFVCFDPHTYQCYLEAMKEMETTERR